MFAQPIHNIIQRINFRKNASCRAHLMARTFHNPKLYDKFITCLIKKENNIITVLKQIIRISRVPEHLILTNHEACYIIIMAIINNDFMTDLDITLWKLKLECVSVKPGHVMRLLWGVETLMKRDYNLLSTLLISEF